MEKMVFIREMKAKRREAKRKNGVHRKDEGKKSGEEREKWCS
ncbi:hypothetical protein [Niallia circulans]